MDGLNVGLNNMIFSKTDEVFRRAGFDEPARKALIQKMMKNRRSLVWVFWLNLVFLMALVIICFWQVAPILNGNYTSFNPSVSMPPGFVFGASGFSGILGVFSIFGSVVADNKVKMLILIDGLGKKSR